MKRALALLAPAVLTIGLVACGGDDDDSPDTTAATVESTDEGTTDETLDATITAPTIAGDDDDTAGAGGDIDTDTLGQIFPDLDDDQLSCLADRVGGVTEAMDPTQAQAIADECDIDPADLTPDMSAISIPDMSGVSIPDNMDEMMQQAFPGLTDQQVSCLVDQLGDDFDVAKAQQVAETCDIEPSDLTPG
jgi:hypothetical protein